MAEKKKDTEWMQFETGHGKKPNQKLKTYLVLQYLMKYSDEGHTVSAEQLVGYLMETCGIYAERRSIYNDIKEISDTVEKINILAFAHCHSLQYVYLGAQLREIGEDAFLDCGKLTKVDIATENRYLFFEKNSVYAIVNNRRRKVIGLAKKQLKKE